MLFLADNDVVAARINSIARLNDHLAVAIAADNFQSTYGTDAMQIAIMQALLGEDIIDPAVQFRLAEKLTGKEAWAVQAL